MTPTPQQLADFMMIDIDKMINDPKWVNSNGDRMPWDVQSFSQLHDYCDANCFIIDAQEHFGYECWAIVVDENSQMMNIDHYSFDLENAATDLITEMLQARVDDVYAQRYEGSRAFANGGYVNVIKANWLTNPYLLWWTDGGTQEETIAFPTFAEATVALGCLLYCVPQDKGFLLAKDMLAFAINQFVNTVTG